MNTKKAGGNNNGAGGEDDDDDKQNGHSNNNCGREEVKLRYTLGKGMNLEVEKLWPSWWIFLHQFVVLFRWLSKKYAW